MRNAPDILKKWRAGRALTIVEAAAMVPCTRQTWHSWERQDGSVPPDGMMAAVCRLTGTQPNDFYHLPHVSTSPVAVSDAGQGHADGEEGVNPQELAA